MMSKNKKNYFIKIMKFLGAMIDFVTILTTKIFFV